MNLKQLKTFRVAAEQGSFSKAAALLFLSQPTVSLHIHGLEEELGVELFQRGSRPTRLSPAGEVVLRYANQFEGLLTSMRHQLDLTANKLRSVVVGCSPSAANTILPDVVRRFRAMAPDVSVRVEVMPIGSVADRLIRGDLDLGLLSRPFITDELAAIPVMRSRLMLMGARSHPLVGRNAVTPEELSRHPFVLLASPSEARSLADLWAATQGVELHIAAESDSFDAVLEAVLSGVGLGFLPERLAEAHLAAGNLVPMPAAGQPLFRMMSICYRAFDELSAPARQLLEAFQSERLSQRAI